MEIVSMLSGRWVEIVAAVYLIGMMLYGHYRGFIRMAVSAASIVITLFAVNFATPYVTDWLKNDTPLYGVIVDGIEHALNLESPEGFFGSEGLPDFEDLPDSDESYDPAGGGFLQMASEKARERLLIEEMQLPSQIKRMLIENNNSEVYGRMGVELFADYVAGYLADLIIRLIVFIILFLAVFILLHVVVVWLDLIAKLPILSGLNQIAGAVLGAAEALIFIWFACLILTALSGTAFGRGLLAQVEASVWLSWIYDHNMLLFLVFGLLQSVL